MQGACRRTLLRQVCDYGLGAALLGLLLVRRLVQASSVRRHRAELEPGYPMSSSSDTERRMKEIGQDSNLLKADASTECGTNLSGDMGVFELELPPEPEATSTSNPLSLRGFGMKTGSSATLAMAQLEEELGLAEAGVEDDFDSMELHHAWGVTDKQSVRLPPSTGLCAIQQQQLWMFAVTHACLVTTRERSGSTGYLSVQRRQMRCRSVKRSSRMMWALQIS